MLDRQISRMKRQLNKMIQTEGLGSDRLLQLSQALDVLIVEVMAQKACRQNSYFEAVQNVRSLKSNSTKELDCSQLRLHQDYTIGDYLFTPIKAG
ncbi:MAG: aspartyl-phosphate phosphatase Spo0E family protein [Clostridia bacterium]|nr:aspartyl-phosphate phosphatase Spo0E family protein [Clostridia bacterium]